MSRLWTPKVMDVTGQAPTFRELFRNRRGVIDNGGSIVGTPTLADAFTTVGTNTDAIYYPQGGSLGGRITKMSIRAIITTPADTASATVIFCRGNTVDTTNRLVWYISGGSLILSISNAALAYFAINPSTTYNVEFVYDGSLAAASRVRAYVSGVSQAVAFVGTIPTSLYSNSSVVLSIGAYANAISGQPGLVVRDLQIWNGIAHELADAQDLYEQDMMRELAPRNATDYVQFAGGPYIGSGGLKYIRNLGSRGNDTVLWGNGAGTGEPTMLNPRGVKCVIGTVRCRSDNYPAAGSTGTVLALTRFTRKSLDGAFTHCVVSLSGPVAAYGTGWMINQLGTAFYAYWGQGPPLIGWANVLTEDVQLLCMRNDAGTLECFIDGHLRSGSIAAPAAVGANLNIGIAGSWDGTFNNPDMNMYHYSYWPTALSLSQMRWLSQRLKREINL